MASKKIKQINLKGVLDMGTMTIEEETKDSIDLYDFKQILEEFDGVNISISLREEEPLPIKEDE